MGVLFALYDYAAFLCVLALGLVVLFRRNNLTAGEITATVDTVREVTEKGGRNDETDLFGKPGRYVRLMDSHVAGKPCPECGRAVEKMQYLGGACYFCPKCQV